ncbi:Chromo domain-containing protein 2 [Stagonosporopsis vannaccii]|nr:Chromo domain-containing protein 2 [Stagonosporopsis vannaccii]
MPPALSDVESSDSEIPATNASKKQPKKAVQPVEPEDEDVEDVGEDEFVVEKIVGHRFNKGVLEFDVKWQGYDNPRDRTWEPESNMETAADVLAEYFDDIGGRPERPDKGTKRKGRASNVKSGTSTPAAAAASKRVKTTQDELIEKAWSPPPGSWEHHVSHIDTVEQSIDPKTGKEAKFAYIVWNNQKKTQHPLKHIYTKCPQKMLLYYESHLVFTPSQTNGDAIDEAF